MSSSEGTTRRQILADAAKLVAAASVSGLAGCFPDVGGSWPAACKDIDAGTPSDAGVPPAVTPAVIEVFRPESSVKNVIQPDVVATMLDTGLTALARQVALFNAGSAAQDGGSEGDAGGQAEPDGGTDNPWKVLLPNYQAGQSIGLKVNCLGSTPTSPALVCAIVASLRDKLGVDPTTKIFVWDRFLTELQGGKYSPSAVAGAQVVGTLTRGVYPKKGESEDDPQFTDGRGYGDTICSAPIGVPSGTDPATYPRLSRILTHETALTINCPVFKIHNISGITGAMKNIYGMINNPGQYHTALATDMPKLYALPDIRNRISLTIFDALVGVVNGNGPEEGHDQTPGRILLAQDPVALDSYALALMNQLRTSSIDPSKTGWLAIAADAGLGTTNYVLYQV